MTLQELKQQVLDLPTPDRWALLKLLIELLQPSSLATSTLTTSPTTPTGSDAHPLAQYYGCIDDETFIRHPQPEQSEREPIL
jgi:hypothetical protein